jgi:hypothetical protein
MSNPTDYSPEEWKVICSAPMMAGLLISMSDMSGPIGIAKEAMAVVKTVTQTATASSSELIRSVAEAIKAQGARPDVSELRTEPTAVRAILIDHCKQAAQLVQQKSPLESEEYREWLVSLAKRTADASKEGGFLGMGGTVSEAENLAVRDLAAALGVSTT